MSRILPPLAPEAFQQDAKRKKTEEPLESPAAENETAGGGVNKRQRVSAGGSFLVFRLRGCRGGVVPRFAMHQSSTLQSLVEYAFELRLERELNDTIDGHCWNLRHNGVSYSSHDGMGHGQIEGVTLASLGLAIGGVLELEYDFGCPSVFEFIVADVEITSACNSSDTCPRDLGVEGSNINHKGPIVSEAEAAENARFLKKYTAYMGGLNEWSWAQCAFKKPEAPRWNSNEAEWKAIDCLLESGIGFTKAWKELLEPCLLLRTRTSCSGYWYKAKKMNEQCGGTFMSKYEREAGANEYLLKARRYLRLAREDALRYPCEKEAPVLYGDKLEIACHEWCKKNAPGTSLSCWGIDSDSDGGDLDPATKAAAERFAQVSMADKVQLYCNARRRSEPGAGLDSDSEGWDGAY
jgi:hypothetical protein